MVAAVLVCLRLGWWQWDRSHEADGTAQNLGYALLWPAFGAAFIYMWLRFLQLEVIRDAEDEVPDQEWIPDTQLLADDLWAGTGDQQTASPAAPNSRGLGGSESDLVIPDDRETGSEDADPTHVAAFEEDEPDPARVPPHRARQRPSQGVTIAVATVGDDADDPELTAYNQALAALAEEDRRRAR